MRFGSVCSGIEAASVALHPIGWTAAWLAEIEPFPSAVLAHHWPQVPNLGDMTKLPAMVRAGLIEAPDALIGGTPCQAFSVAGMRAGLIDPRGQLTLTYVDLLNAIDEQRPGDECIGWWENVPGVLSDRGNAFGCFLGLLAGEECELVPPGKSWPNAGVVHGPQRTIAWRVLDAQFFGVAQRRRRVFVITSARAGFDPAAILFEPEGVRRDTAPRREAGEDAADTLASRTGAGGFPGTDEACSGYVQPVATAYGGNNTAGPIDVATARNACSSSSGRLDFESETFLVQAVDVRNGTLNPHVTQTIQAGACAPDPAGTPHVLAFHSNAQPDHPAVSSSLTCSQTAAVAYSVALRGRDGGATAELGGDLAGTLRASGGGGGDKAHVLTYAIQAGALRTNPESGPGGVGVRADVAYTLEARAEVQAVCVTEPVTHCLKAEGFDASEDGTGRGQPIVAAFKSGQSEAEGGVFLTEEFARTLQAQNNGSTAVPAIQYGMAVRRLTPRECERLQGFPSIRKEITIRICLDHQNNSVDAALSCRKWLTDASTVDAERWAPSVAVVGQISNTSQADHEPLAALRVRTNSVDELLEIHSHGRSTWSVSSAATSSKYPLPMASGAIAAALAQVGRALAREAIDGKAALQPNIRLSMPVRSGAPNALKSGVESGVYASGAASDASLAKFTTFELGRATPTYDSTAAISLCSALAAISSCIPGEILPANFSLILDVETPYTLVPVRGKPAADGPRYKALGNSMAVPCMLWIGRRITAAMVHA